MPEHIWEPAYDPDDSPREGVDVAELTGLMELAEWPKGMRVLFLGYVGAHRRGDRATGLRRRPARPPCVHPRHLDP